MSQFKTIKGSEARIIEEVSMTLHTVGMHGGKEFDSLFARHVPVIVEFAYTPGAPARSQGAMEDAEEAIPAEMVITAMRTTTIFCLDSSGGGLLSYGAGYDILPLLPEVEIEAIEEELLKKTGK